MLAVLRLVLARCHRALRSQHAGWANAVVASELGTACWMIGFRIEASIGRGKDRGIERAQPAIFITSIADRGHDQQITGASSSHVQDSRGFFDVALFLF